MPNLNTRTKKICGFVRDLKKPMTDKDLSALSSWFNGLAEQWFISLHDMDTDVETGELETPHIHFVADMRQASRLKTFLNAIAEVCGVSSQAVSIEKYRYFELAIQYLIHQNEVEPNKYHYPPERIFTNVPEDLIIYLSYKPDIFDFNSICSYIVHCCTISQLIGEIGIKKYHAYRALIRDLWDEYLKGRLFYQGRYYCLGMGGRNAENGKEEAS